MSDNKRNSKYRHPRYYVIGLIPAEASKIVNYIKF